MMKRLLALSMAIATIGLASTATALPVPWAPINTNITFSNVGNMTVSKGITLTCGLSGAGFINGVGAGSVTSLSLIPGSFLCPLVAFANLPYTLARPNPTTAVLQNVAVTAITGNCLGNLTGTCNMGTGQIVFSGATIPSSPPGGSSCTITGTVATTPALNC